MKFIVNIILCLASYLGFTQVPAGTEHFRIPRSLPFRDIGETQKIFVSDFTTTAATTTAAILNALIALSEMEGKAELIFDDERYELESDVDGGFFFRIEGMRDKVINGDHAQIILKNPTKGFLQLLNARNCIIKGFVVDYHPLPFVQGKVVAVDYDEGTFDCLVETWSPGFDAEHVRKAPQHWAMIKDPARPGAVKNNTRPIPSTLKQAQLSTNLYRLTVNAKFIESFSVGDVYVQLARYNGSTVINTSNCERISIVGITIYSSPAGGFNARGSADINVLDCKVLMKGGRHISTNADCLHHMNMRIGTWVEGCIFEGHSDDTFNFKWGKSTIKSQPSSDQILLEDAVSPQELLWIYNPRDGVLVDSVRVKNVRHVDQGYVVTVNRHLPRLVTGYNNQRDDQVYLDSHRSESFVIRNNIIRNHNRYGMLLQAGYGLIENNHLENSSNSAIAIENKVDWGEGLVAEELLIRNNVFRNTGNDLTFSSENRAAIFLQTSSLLDIDSKSRWCGTEPASWRGMNSITIEGNRFEQWNNKAISVNSANSVSIINNYFSGPKTASGQYISTTNAEIHHSGNTFER